MADVPCRIAAALGAVEACPEAACPFWEHGALGAACGLERLDLELDRPDLAAHLVDVRQALVAARTVREREEEQRLHAALWPPELSGR